MEYPYDLIVSNLPHEVLLPNFLLRYLTVRRVQLSVGAVDTTSESLGGARWGPSAGERLCPGLVAAGRQCVPAASYAPVGPFSRPVAAGPPGAVCPRWRVARVTPGGSWIHGSGPLHWRTADRGHSFGCQLDKPSASLVTTNKTSMCIDLQMCVYSCMLLIVFCWE